jgi:hypothetical protein
MRQGRLVRWLLLYIEGTIVGSFPAARRIDSGTSQYSREGSRTNVPSTSNRLVTATNSATPASLATSERHSRDMNRLRGQILRIKRLGRAEICSQPISVWCSETMRAAVNILDSMELVGVLLRLTYL